MSQAIPERLRSALADRYELHSELGAGSMATVYLADDLKHEREVAVKVLRPELAAVIGAERFITEIKTTAALQHPHILPLFDSGEADSFLYYVMPYVEGESLRTRLDLERQLEVDEAIHITKAVASALQYAHERDVIHRDIKPENILLHAGEPVVADFGIALAISAAGAGRMTETGLSLGTPHYMSPKQAAADRDLSARSDVYSLACVLYEMLTGQPPHTGPTAQSILVRILHRGPATGRRNATERAKARPRGGIEGPGEVARGSLQERGGVQGRARRHGVHVRTSAGDGRGTGRVHCRHVRPVCQWRRQGTRARPDPHRGDGDARGGDRLAGALESAGAGGTRRRAGRLFCHARFGRPDNLTRRGARRDDRLHPSR